MLAIKRKHREVDEGKQKVYLSYRKMGRHNARKVTTSQQKKTSQRNFADKSESEFSNSQRKVSTGQMFESRGMRLVRESVGNKSAKLYRPYLKLYRPYLKLRSIQSDVSE